MSTQLIDLIDLKTKALERWYEEKSQLSTDWINNESIVFGRIIVQKGIYFCKMGENIGGEINSNIGRDRPVLVISNCRVNRGPTILIAPLTKRLRTIIKNGEQVPRLKMHYFLSRHKYNFLTYDSAIKLEDIRSVSKIRLTTQIGEIDAADFNQIRNKISWMFSPNI